MTSYASHTATFYTSKHGFVHFTNSHVFQVNKRLCSLYLQPSFTRHKMTSYTSSTAKLYTSKNDFIHFTNSQVVQVKNDFVHFTLSHVLHVKKRLRTLHIQSSFTRQKTTSYTSHTAKSYTSKNDFIHFTNSQVVQVENDFVHFTLSHVSHVKKRLRTLPLKPSFTRQKTTSYTSHTAEIYRLQNDSHHFNDSQNLKIKMQLL